MKKPLQLAPVKIAKPLDREQRSFLESELRSVTRGFDRYPSEKFFLKNAPASVKRAFKAAKKVDRWIARERKRRDKVAARVEKFAEVVREEMLFGDPRKALKMIRDFQAVQNED